MLCSVKVNCQYIYGEKFENCNSKYFRTEAEYISVKIINDFVQMLSSNLENKVVKDIRGILSLQIIVDINGKSCLLSFENDTNIDSSNLPLKTIIDNRLFWEKPKENTAVILAIKFFGNEVELKRIGMSKEKGFHELPE